MSRLHDVESASGSVIWIVLSVDCVVLELISSAVCEQLFGTRNKRHEEHTLVGNALHETGGPLAVVETCIGQVVLTIECHLSCRRTSGPADS